MSKCKLGSICTITSSKRIFENEYVSNGIPFIRGLEISDGSVLDENAKYECYISEKRYKELKETNGVPKKGDILITAVGTIGNLCYINKDMDFYFKDGNVIWFKDFHENVYSKFLFYFMKSAYFKKQLESSMIGAVQKALTMKMLSEINLDLPDYNTQVLIVKVLESIDNKIANNNKINTELEEMAKTIYDYWFLQFEFPNEEGKPYKSNGGKMVWNEELKREIPEGWEVDILKNCISQEKNAIVDGPFGTQLKIGEYVDFGVPIYEMEQLNGKFIVNKPKHFITNEKYSEVKRSSVKNGDIIISKTGTLGLLGIVRSTYDNGIIVSRLAKITPDENKIGKYTLLIFLGKLTENGYWLKQSNGSTMPILNNALIENTKVILPKNELYLEFENIIKPFYEKIYNIQKENQELTSLRDFLLPLLMNGQVGFKEVALAGE